MDKVLADLEDKFIPDLRARLVHKSYVTPDHFEHRMRSHLGNAFGVEPVLTQSAFFRPHNRSEDIDGLYLVGASAQPGARAPERDDVGQDDGALHRRRPGKYLGARLGLTCGATR